MSKQIMSLDYRADEQLSMGAVTVLDLFSSFPIIEGICSFLEIGDIISLTRTCKPLSPLYRTLLSSQWNVDKHLRRFVDNPLAFRGQMAKCDALVSGSLALQIFERTMWLDSDLDIYVNAEGSIQFGRYLYEEEGYVYAEDKDLAGDYPTLNELVEVHTLIKDRPAGDSTKIQIVTTKTDPLLCILGGFYSTIVVCFFSWQKAYSVFARPTFIDRRAYMLKQMNEYHAPLLSKYSRRGWDFQDVVWPGEPSVAALQPTRWVGDCHTWTIPFNTDGVKSLGGTPDHVFTHANFSVERHDNASWQGSGPTYYHITAKIFKALVLRHKYIYASESWKSFLGTRMDSLTTMELLKLDPSVRPVWFQDAIAFPIAHYRNDYGFVPPKTWKYYDEDVPKWYRQWESFQAEMS